MNPTQKPAETPETDAALKSPHNFVRTVEVSRSLEVRLQSSQEREATLRQQLATLETKDISLCHQNGNLLLEQYDLKKQLSKLIGSPTELNKLGTENTRLRQRLTESEAKLDTLLTDVNYDGGLQSWIKKHNDLLVRVLEIEAANGQMRDAVQRNHVWHQTYDEHDGYSGSELYDVNTSALSSTSGTDWHSPEEWKEVQEDVEKRISELSTKVAMAGKLQNLTEGNQVKWMEKHETLNKVYLRQLDTIMSLRAELAQAREEGSRLKDLAETANNQSARLLDVNSQLRNQLSTALRERDEARLAINDWREANFNGHPQPCTLGPLCPYCEITRLQTQLAAQTALCEALRAALQDFVAAETNDEETYQFARRFEKLLTLTPESALAPVKAALLAARRLLDGKYHAWSMSGGNEECEHGYNKSIPCPACDLMTLNAALTSLGITLDGEAE